MKKVLLPVLLMSSAVVMAQQSFSGLKNGYRSGVHRVLSNPANIAGSSYKWHANLFSVGVSSYNSEVGLSEMMDQIDDIENTLAGSLNGVSSQSFSSTTYADALLPSFMLRINKRHSLALTSRFRTFVHIDNFDVKLFQTLFTDIDKIGWTENPIAVKNQSLRVNAFADVGLTWASTVMETSKHSLRVGATAKYVMGMANGYLGIEDLKGSLSIDKTNYEATLNATGQLHSVAAGANYEELSLSKLTSVKTSAVGFDLGVTYEYRSADKPNAPYKIKAGLSVTDIGTMKYTPAEDMRYTYELNATTITYKDDFEKKLEEVITKTAVGDYKVSLPTALQTYVDYNAGGGLGVELSGQFGLTKGTQQNPYYGTDISLTPRFEKKYFGFFLPISYSNITKVNMGTVLKLGPVFVGSGTILSNVMGNSKGVDVFAGISFGM